MSFCSERRGGMTDAWYCCRKALLGMRGTPAWPDPSALLQLFNILLYGGLNEVMDVFDGFSSVIQEYIIEVRYNLESDYRTKPVRYCIRWERIFLPHYGPRSRMSECRTVKRYYSKKAACDYHCKECNIVQEFCVWMINGHAPIA